MTRQPVDPWFKFFPRDWLEGTRALTLEQRGAYIDAIAMQMIHGGPLPNDYSWLGHQMHVSSRKAEAIVEALIEAMKLKRTEGGITNDRCEEEIRARDHQRRTNTEIAVKRERERRENLASGRRDVAHNAKNDNKNNVGVETSCTETGTTRARLDSESEEEKKEYMPTEGVGVGAEEANPKARKVRSYTAEFEAFWQAFPVQDGKWAAFDKSWRKLSAEDRARATEGAALYADRVRRESIERPKWAQGWLTERRWEDEFRRASPADDQRRYWWQDPEKLASVDGDGWDRLIEKHANGTWPVDKLGFWPGHAKCVVPDSVVQRRGLLDIYDHNGIARGTKAHA